MSMQFGRAYFARRYLELTVNQFEFEPFMIGALFPDIRQLGTISREATHLEGASFRALAEETSSFRAGMLIHNLIDTLRVGYLKEHGVDEVDDMLLATPQKLIEDELVYSHQADWSREIKVLDKVLDNELALVQEATVLLWHRIIQDYFRAGPTPAAFEILGLQLVGSSPKLLANIEQRRLSLGQDRERRALINSFIAEFDRLVVAHG
ncbi:hypothetical protein HJC99_02210 [Candidatus Saccharibacteria bacterium]|nr:hypothetical protein [Candidatus Saccharibacteria bacterium]